MAQMRITHRQIEAFRALMMTGSMTEAAQLLSVTQPAVSKIISQLESEARFSLFDRRQGKLKPTDEAYILYAEVKQSYNGLDRVMLAAQRIQSGIGGSLRVAVLPTLASGFLVEVVRKLYADGNDLQLSLQAFGSEEIADLVASGMYDIGFSTTPVDTSRVNVGSVLSVPSFCILPPGHRLTDKKEISLLDLNGERFIAIAEGVPSRLRSDALFTSMNVSRNIVIEARWSLTIADLVQAGLGCSIVDGFTAHTLAARGGTVRPITEALDFTFVQVTRKSASRTAALRRFEGLFESSFREFKQNLTISNIGYPIS